MAQGLHLLNTIIFKYVYWYMKQISGERLQDHWSSGFEMAVLLRNKNVSNSFTKFIVKKYHRRHNLILNSYLCNNPLNFYTDGYGQILLSSDQGLYV